MASNNFQIKMKKRLYGYSLTVIKVIKKLPNNMDSQVLAKQLIRSATSVAANFIEATGASSKKDFINFYHYALKSANESKFWLALIRDVNNLNNDEINNLITETNEISNILAASIITLKKNK